MQSIRIFIYSKLTDAEWYLSPTCAVDMPPSEKLVPSAETASHPNCLAEVA
jgi:hypothetical protein